QRRGARTALVTTAGFEDVIEIGRQARPELYNLNAVKPSPLVPSELRFGVHAHVAASREILEPLRDSDVEELVEKLLRAHCESFASCNLRVAASLLKLQQANRCARSCQGRPAALSARYVRRAQPDSQTSSRSIWAARQPTSGCPIANKCV